MAIRIQCACGKRLLAENEQAGGQVRCPSCQAVMAVPLPAEETGSYGVEQLRKCPGCKRDWPLETVVCIECGYNFETGRKLRTRVRIIDQILTVGVVWLGCYTRYRIFRNNRSKPCLTVTVKLFFLPVSDRTYDLSDYRSVVTDFATAQIRGENDTFSLELQGPNRKPVTIFRSSNEEKMKELVDLVKQAGGLEIRRK